MGIMNHKDEWLNQLANEAADLIDRQKAELAASQADNTALRVALDKINAIRNSIIGFQTVNWSEHIYPLVAALKEAGLDGLPYHEARVKSLSQEDLIAALRAELAAARAKVDRLELAARQKLEAGRNSEGGNDGE